MVLGACAWALEVSNAVARMAKQILCFIAVFALFGCLGLFRAGLPLPGTERTAQEGHAKFETPFRYRRRGRKQVTSDRTAELWRWRSPRHCSRLAQHS